MIIKKVYRDHFEALHRLAMAIRNVHAPEELFPLVLEEIAAVLKVERASIMRFDPEAGVLRMVAAKGISPKEWDSIVIPVGEGVSGRVFAEKTPLLVKDVARSLKQNPKSDYKTKSFMATPIRMFPMQVKERPIGVINVTDKTDRGSFSEKDLQLLTMIADQLGAYLHLQDVGKAHHQLEMARVIQERLLPRQMPKTQGLEVAAKLIPAERVGADYYDFMNGTSSLDLLIADVSGHDVGGALLAQELRTCFRLKGMEGMIPSEFLSFLNQSLFDDFLSSEQFASMVYARFDAEKKSLSYTNAGHNPPLWVRPKKRGVEWLFTEDPLVGIERNVDYHEKTIFLEKGDVVLFYTDGLTESEGSKGYYGQNRLQSVVQEHGSASAEGILGAVLEDWKKFRGKKPPKDDVTLLVLKMVP